MSQRMVKVKVKVKVKATHRKWGAALNGKGKIKTRSDIIAFNTRIGHIEIE